ncbi:Ankyrin repeat protein 1 [Giardia muris]|uniref:Ankyrin repeat protein 1 n=1 Tax=Giardia muris TaxID=5742 RepID=A0A4Z1SXN2_GIAMU|nr:Ankyrin repeat protein 1 [Giardia muris]|eukprot:TNJ30280.1 Ankyrin repeat protein 1 [Giardia muris]
MQAIPNGQQVIQTPTGGTIKTILLSSPGGNQPGASYAPQQGGMGQQTYIQAPGDYQSVGAAQPTMAYPVVRGQNEAPASYYTSQVPAQTVRQSYAQDPLYSEPISYGQPYCVQQEFFQHEPAYNERGIPNETFRRTISNPQKDPLFSLEVVDLMNQVDERRFTPLMQAAVRNDYPALTKLIPKEAGLTIENGVTALMIAASLGHTQCVKALIPKEAGMRQNDGTTALMEAVLKGNTSVVSMLIKSEAGMRRDDGFSCLMLCAQYNYPEIAKLLVSYEAGLKTDLGVTALMVAAEYDADDVFDLLIKKEAGLRANNGWTASMSLVAKRKVEQVKKIASKEVGYAKDDGWTCLMSACANNDEQCAKLFMKEAGFSKKDGTTALMWAAARGNETLCKMLSKAECDLVTLAGKSAIDFAEENGHGDLIKTINPREYARMQKKSKGKKSGK